MLGATEVDVNFHANVNTHSDRHIRPVEEIKSEVEAG